MKRVIAFLMLLTVLLFQARFPAAVASDGEDPENGCLVENTYDLTAEAIAIGLLNTDLTINKAFTPPRIPATDAPTTHGPEDETRISDEQTTPDYRRPEGMIALAKAAGIDEAGLYAMLGRAAAKSRDNERVTSITGLLGEPQSEEPGPAEWEGTPSPREEIRFYSKNFEYYDSAGNQLWSVVMPAYYRITPNSAVCTDAFVLFDSADSRWRLAEEDRSVTISGSAVTGCFTVRKYLGPIPTAAAERTLKLFVTPRGIYKGDHAEILKGDVNGNGRNDAADARLALRAAARTDRPTEDAFIAGDLNADGAVTASDARKILRKAARLQ